MDQDEHEDWKGETKSRDARQRQQYEQALRRIEMAQDDRLDALAYAYAVVRYVEPDDELRARILAAATGRRADAGSMASIASALLVVLESERPEGVTMGQAKKSVAVHWLREDRPRRLFARLGWWWRLWWVMR